MSGTLSREANQQAMKRILITSALPYVNGVKHLGNLVGSMLPADVFARFCRARGYDTLAICATDEHGAPIELAALEEGMPVADYCAKWHQVQRDLGEAFGLSWDHFGRSSSAQNRELTLHFARQLWKNGFLEVRTTKQAYSATDGRFLPDRYVIGTCPHCGYDRARGDQCENCTRVLDPVDLIEPRSAVSGAQDIEIRDSTHLFLKQSQFVDQLRAWIDSHKNGLAAASSPPSPTNGWTRACRTAASPAIWNGAFRCPTTSPTASSRARSSTSGSMRPSNISPPPRNGPTHNNKGDAWRDWWFGDKAKDVTYWEFMGKDNVPFHTVGFPVTIMGIGRTLEDGGPAQGLQLAQL